MAARSEHNHERAYMPAGWVVGGKIREIEGLKCVRETLMASLIHEPIYGFRSLRRITEFYCNSSQRDEILTHVYLHIFAHYNAERNEMMRNG